MKENLEAASERTNVPGSSERKWTPFHHPLEMRTKKEGKYTKGDYLIGGGQVGSRFKRQTVLSKLK